MIDAEDLAAWEELEATCWTPAMHHAHVEAQLEADETRRVDLVRIRGFCLAMSERTLDAREKASRALDSLVRARQNAERALDDLRWATAFTERVYRFAARAMAGDADAETVREAACALEEWFG